MVALRIIFALALFVVWAGVSFYLVVFLYFLPVRYPWLMGLPQFAIGISILLASMLSYAVVVSRLFGKKKAEDVL
jgi:hypothetical protein